MQKLGTYVVFEGGGAKGIRHLAVLRYLEFRRLGYEFDLKGFAGTSIGAIVASLAACGYRSGDLIDPATGQSPLFREVLKIEATALFGTRPWLGKQRWFRSRGWLGAWSGGWMRIVLFRRLAYHPMSFFFSIVAIVILLNIAVIAACVALSLEVVPAFLVLIVFQVLGFLAGFGVLRTLIAGLCTTDQLIAELNRAMCLKLKPGTPPDWTVEFKDLPKPLHIVATNLTDRRLELFSTSLPHCRTLPVARCVAASAALPFAFRPVSIDMPPDGAADAIGPQQRKKKKFCDGGLVSNLPVWTFEQELEIDPDCITVAVEVDQLGVRNTDGAFNLMSRIVLAALYGARSLEKRTDAGRLYQISLDENYNSPKPLVSAPPVQLLDFDMKRSQVRHEFHHGFFRAEAYLTDRLRKREAIRDACSQVAASFAAVPLWRNQAGTVRVHVAQKVAAFHGDNHIRIRESAHAVVGEPDPVQFSDDRLLLPTRRALAHEVVDRPRLFAQPWRKDLSLSTTADRYRQPLVWNRMRWCLIIPLAPFAPREEWVLENFDFVFVDSDLPCEAFGLDDDHEITSEIARNMVRGLVRKPVANMAEA